MARCATCGNMTRFCICNRPPPPAGPSPFEVQHARVASGGKPPTPEDFVIDALGGDPDTDSLFLCERGCGLTIQGECAYGGFHLDEGHRDEVTWLTVRPQLPDHVRPIAYLATQLPLSNMDAGAWSITVEYAGERGWRVNRGWSHAAGGTPAQFGKDGTISFGPPTLDEGEEETRFHREAVEAWWENHRWENVIDALQFASRMLPDGFTVNGMTSNEVVAHHREKGNL